MAYAGQRIYNPITREHITFLQMARDSGGRLVRFECRVAPGGERLPVHVHRSQEERFEVLAGSLGVLLGDTEQTLSVGETIVLPARIKHQWWNAGDGEVAFRVEVAPAGNMERVLEAIAGMARDGGLNRKCLPRNPLRMAQLARLSETYLPGIPIWIQRVGITMGSGVARLIGFDPEFAEYATAERVRLEVA
jgi:mannose-6-phosphate isomerase-like protein (cupin superfamily)